ncbi:MAG: glutamate synthase-related protein [Anaerolineae bacterium]|nr:glutamate synthase-related protein [Anaerolineae bacterium]
MSTRDAFDAFGRFRPPDPVSEEEHDACAIVASIRASGESTHGNLKRTIEALGKMGHRSGDVQSEGDGCGILADIPRKIWTAAIDAVGRPAWLAGDKRFFVGHLLIPEDQRAHIQTWQARALRLFSSKGADMLLERPGATLREALGRLARAQEPIFWQVAGVLSQCPLESVEPTLFEIAQAIESQTPIHVASLSSHSVIYKVRGSVETLYHYYPELRNRDFTSAITIGHARYSTNTTTAFERVQPFSLLGHNGEINTISRLREQMAMLGAERVRGGSDSQDLNRLVEALINQYGLDVIEALEIVFPPILSEVKRMPEAYQDVYRYYRRALGPYAQGPAAIVARHGDTCIGSVDALGLRPLWFGQTEKECFFSSEKGVVPTDLLNSDPKPLAPGEKIAVQLLRDDGVRVLDYSQVQRHVTDRALKRYGRRMVAAPMIPNHDSGRTWWAAANDNVSQPIGPTPAFLAAFGWTADDLAWVHDIAEHGKDPVASLGYDGPLAALGEGVRNLSDYFKEKIAVVTNPAIDREREQEHFSTEIIIGPRAPLKAFDTDDAALAPCVVLDVPILVGGHSTPLLQVDTYRALATRNATMLLEDLVATFDRSEAVILSLATRPKEPVRPAANRLVRDAVEAVERGAKLIVIDDGLALQGERGWVPVHLAVAMVDKALRSSNAAGLFPDTCRRNVGLVVHSSAIRNLHDIIVALGLGADAVAPSLLLEVAANALEQDTDETRAQAVPTAAVRFQPALTARIDNTLDALRVGIEKVASTMGIHELRGYGRIFSTIGISTGLVELLDVPNFAGGGERGLTWDDLTRDAERRRQLVVGDTTSVPRVPRLYPLLRKPLRQIAQGLVDPSAAFATIREQEKSRPVALRHVMGFNPPAVAVGSELRLKSQDVDAAITGHDLPFVIASMSFGSQSEIAYRAYAEAAKRLNIIALNGEGGEIDDLMGRYPHNRGQQIASGRFGVNVTMLNASNLLEIKIGQGAKPGEGGHLPGQKVSAKIARARHVSPGIDLISPSNNHDIYSIEDLAQFIEELKTANPKARVAVKVPIVPDIGLVAVGVAKAGADIINLSGYDGGTGAARAHSIRHVGLPAEIGVAESHRALLASGMRQRVEIWADGGVRSPDDAVKLMCLGADRIGFGTLAMVAIGCLLCRNCMSGECPMGITTQIETEEEAKARGMKHFTPQDLDRAILGLVTLFCALGDEVKRIAAELGVERLRDLVGRADLLEQVSHFQQLNLQQLLTPASQTVSTADRASGPVPLRRPRNHLTTMVSNVVMEAVAAGETRVSFEDGRVTPVDRALGAHLAGALRRYQQSWDWLPGHNGVGGEAESWRNPVGGNGNGRVDEANLRFYASSVPGNGLGAFCCAPIKITVEGGAQDGVGKGLFGGGIVVLKGYNHDGVRIDGSVGKGLGYGAIRGTIIVQGNADSRACVRLSGADVVIGGEITEPLRDDLSLLGARANVKGFLCEYMTAGRVLVLGDPGPWICAGMTGGVLYLRPRPSLGFDEAAMRRRIARGADVVLQPVSPQDETNLHELLTTYAYELEQNHQSEEADRALALLGDWRRQFVRIVPSRVAEVACAVDETFAGQSLLGESS